MKRKEKYIVIGLIVLLVGLYFYLMSLPTIEGFITRIDILPGTYLSPDLIKSDGAVDFDLTPEQIEELIKNPDDYLYLQYIFNLKNLSNWEKVYDVKLNPTFPEKTQNIVVAYKKKGRDGMVAPIFIDKNSKIKRGKLIIIKKQVVDEDFLKLIKEVKFEAWGKVGLSGSNLDFIRIGSCSAILDNPQDIHIEDQTKVKEEK